MTKIFSNQDINIQVKDGLDVFDAAKISADEIMKGELELMQYILATTGLMLGAKYNCDPIKVLDRIYNIMIELSDEDDEVEKENILSLDEVECAGSFDDPDRDIDEIKKNENIRSIDPTEPYCNGFPVIVRNKIKN